jgi:hypothetical protein
MLTSILDVATCPERESTCCCPYLCRQSNVRTFGTDWSVDGGSSGTGLGWDGQMRLVVGASVVVGAPLADYIRAS